MDEMNRTVTQLHPNKETTTAADDSSTDNRHT